MKSRIVVDCFEFEAGIYVASVTPGAYGMLIQ